MCGQDIHLRKLKRFADAHIKNLLDFWTNIQAN